MTSSPGPAPASSETPYTSPRRLFFTVFPSIMLPMFMAMGDQTIVASALPAIAGALGDVERVSWIVVGYLVAVTIAAPVYGYLGDLFGRRRLMFIALGVYITASMVSAFAPTVPLLAMSRFAQGLGGGGLMALSQALIGEAVPPRQRGQFQGYLAGIGVSASAFGPVAGAFLTEHFGWRAVFFLNVPTGIIAVLLTMRLQARPGNRQANWHFDMLGLVYFIAVVAPVLFALDQIRAFDAARLPLILTMLGGAAVALFLLIRRESAVASPLLPVKLLRQSAIWRADLMAVCHGATLVSLVAFMPIYLRVVRQATSSQISYVLLSITAGIGLGSVMTGRIVTRTGQTMIFPSIGLMVGTCTLIFFALVSPQLTVPQLAAVLVLNSFSMGSVMGVIQVTVQTAAGPRALGQAASSVQLSRSVGAAVGTAAIGTVLFATLASRDPEAGRLFGAILQSGPAALDLLSLDRRAVVTDEIAYAFRAAFITLAFFTTIGSVLAWTNPMRRV
ncbi:MAG: transporter [Hyphomicrobiales bacterium]|nr:transporter [Hyphomicrobiales bacterium]